MNTDNNKYYFIKGYDNKNPIFGIRTLRYSFAPGTSLKIEKGIFLGWFKVLEVKKVSSTEFYKNLISI